MRTFSGFLVLFNTLAFAAEPLPPPPPPPPPSSDFQAEPPPPPPAEPADPKGPKKNWAQGAAYSGFAMGAVVVALGITAHFTGHGYDEQSTLYNTNYYVPGALLMLGATLVTAIGVPVVNSGGKSARWTSSITGLFPLRIAGWIAFGVGLAFEAGAIFYNGVPSWVGGLLGGGALAMFGADALRSAQEAADVAVMASNESGFHIAPLVSILPGRNGNAPGPMLGVAGVF